MHTLASAGLSEPIVELAALWRARSGDVLPLSSRTNITAELLKQLEDDVERRANGEPIARILGAREFYSREFRLNNACLIPRPDSETIIDALLEIIEKAISPITHIHELGCGSGCLIITLVDNLQSARRGLGKRKGSHKLRLISASDKSLKALLAARKNSAQAKNNSILFSHSDWLVNKQSRYPDKFDLIFANPPYLRRKDRCYLQREVQNFEPPLALDGGFDGLASLRDICTQAIKKLHIGGLLLLEHSPEQSTALEVFAKKKGYAKIKTYRDLNGQKRATLLKRKRSNKTLD